MSEGMSVCKTESDVTVSTEIYLYIHGVTIKMKRPMQEIKCKPANTDSNVVSKLYEVTYLFAFYTQ